MRLPNTSAPVVRETKTKTDIIAQAAFSHIQPLGKTNPRDVAQCMTYSGAAAAACLVAFLRKGGQGQLSKQCRDMLINAGGSCTQVVKQISSK